MKHGSKILCGFAVVGVVGTAITSSIATRKALERLQEVKDATGVDPPNKKEAVKLVAKYYIPPIITIVGTVGCVIGAESLNAKALAGAAASFALLKKSYEKYGQAVKNVFGLEGNQVVQREMIRLDGKPVPEKEEIYWIGFGYDDYFKAKPSDIERAEYIMNRKLRQWETVTVGDFMDLIGVEANCLANGWGWGRHELFNDMDDGWLCVKLDPIDTDTDCPAYAITFDCLPTEDFEAHDRWYKADDSDRQVPWEDNQK